MVLVRWWPPLGTQVQLVGQLCRFPGHERKPPKNLTGSSSKVLRIPAVWGGPQPILQHSAIRYLQCTYLTHNVEGTLANVHTGIGTGSTTLASLRGSATRWNVGKALVQVVDVPWVKLLTARVH